MLKNEYIPFPAIIGKIERESLDIQTFRVTFKDKKLGENFNYKPGQFMQISLLGVGEAPISITSSPTRKGFLEFTIRAVGRVTRAIYQLKGRDKIYIRGPYGNSFPFEEVQGKDLYFIAGGIGLPPLRSVINSVFDRRNDFGRVTILYGARTPDELCFKKELERWRKIRDTKVLVTVDNPNSQWQGHVGVVTTLWDKADISGSGGIAYVCGPPIMIKFVVEKLLRSKFKDEHIYVSLERYMKCGIGKCGHCNIDEKFVCLDGPVFTYNQIKRFPEKEMAI